MPAHRALTAHGRVMFAAGVSRIRSGSAELLFASRDTGHPRRMTTSIDFPSPVHLTAVAADNLPAVTPDLEELYRGFERELLVPLWTEIGDLMPLSPQSKAVPHRWRWDSLRALAARAGELVPVGRG